MEELTTCVKIPKIILNKIPNTYPYKRKITFQVHVYIYI